MCAISDWMMIIPFLLWYQLFQPYSDSIDSTTNDNSSHTNSTTNDNSSDTNSTSNDNSSHTSTTYDNNSSHANTTIINDSSPTLLITIPALLCLVKSGK